MMNPAEYQVEQIQFFFLMFARIMAMMAVFPIFGSRNVPWQVRVGISFLLAILLFPMTRPAVVELPNQLIPYAILIGKEVLVGLTIGFVTSLIFTGVSLAGNVIDRQVGFAMARTVDPMTGGGTSVFGSFKVILFTLIFLGLHGHQFLMLALIKSFDRIPILGVNFQTGRLSEVMMHFVASVFEIGLRLSAPVLILVLLVSMASGVLSRTVPQMNLFVVNLPAKIAIAVLGMALMLPLMFYVFEKAYHQMQDNILNILILMA